MSAAPVRGTQSFVGIMSAVWRRPSLTLLEVLWRWSPVLLLSAMAWAIGLLGRRAGINVQLSIPSLAGSDLVAIQNISAFQPVAAVQAVSAAWRDTWSSLGPALLWLFPLVFLLWNIVAALGRTLVLRRFDNSLQPRRATVFILGILRSGLLLGFWWLWVKLLGFSASVAILNPAAHNQEPSVVVLAAMLIVGTLALYVLWAIVSWSLQLAPLLAMHNASGAWASLLAALRSFRVRGKLIEINLVMHIVRIGLLVLAMVFSATPLPFSSVTTDTFLHFWWAGVAVVYLAASDYFHVVRAVSYLSLFRAIES